MKLNKALVSGAVVAAIASASLVAATPAQAAVTYYEHNNYAGRAYKSGVSSDIGWMKNQASSLKSDTTYSYFDGTGWSGWSFTSRSSYIALGSVNNNLPPLLNWGDRIDSAR